MKPNNCLQLDNRSIKQCGELLEKIEKSIIFVNITCLWSGNLFVLLLLGVRTRSLAARESALLLPGLSRLVSLTLRCAALLLELAVAADYKVYSIEIDISLVKKNIKMLNNLKFYLVLTCDQKTKLQANCSHKYTIQKIKRTI